MKNKLLSEMTVEEINKFCEIVINEVTKKCKKSKKEKKEAYNNFLEQVSKSYRIPMRYLKGE